MTTVVEGTSKSGNKVDHVEETEAFASFHVLKQNPVKFILLVVPRGGRPERFFAQHRGRNARAIFDSTSSFLKVSGRLGSIGYRLRVGKSRGKHSAGRPPTIKPLVYGVIGVTVLAASGILFEFAQPVPSGASAQLPMPTHPVVSFYSIEGYGEGPVKTPVVVQRTVSDPNAIADPYPGMNSPVTPTLPGDSTTPAP